MSLRKLPITTPTLLLDANEGRVRVKIQMQATNVDSNNTGKIFLTTGRQPIGTVGHPGQGDVLLQGAGIEEPAGGGVIDSRWKQQIWAVSDTADQTLTVEEVVLNGEEKEE